MRLPLFNAILQTDEDGINVISFVSNPATEIPALYFNEETPLYFADESQRMITSVVMLCETPIYRRNGNFEYFIQYERQTLEDMTRKMLRDNTFNNISFEHNGEIIPAGNIELVELYLKDENKPSPFKNIKNGSVVATYKVLNEKMWESLKASGPSISLEGYFGIKEVENEYIDKFYTNEQKNNNNKMKIKDAFKRLLTNFTEIVVDENTWVFDGELEVGTAVALDNGDAVEDGEYEVEGKKIVIKDSAVESITEVEAETEEVEAEEETVTEEVVEETPAEPEVEENDLRAELDALKAIVDTLVADVESIKTTLSDLVKTPVAEPAVDEYSNVVKKETGSKLKNTANILSLK